MPKELLQYEPQSVLDDGLIFSGSLRIGEQEVPHLITADFPPTDPWSQFFRSIISELEHQNWFRNKPLLELGIGSGGNERVAGNGISQIIGVDVVAEKLDAASQNFLSDDNLREVPTELYHMRAQDFLALWDTREIGKFSGRVLMCLPQSKTKLFQYSTDADTYSEPIVSHIWHVLFSRWEKYGLTLNATVLEKLRKIVADDTEALMILSDRIMPEIKERMIEEKGWTIVEKDITRVKQDWDTKLDWMKGLEKEDDGNRFYDSDNNPLPTNVAIDRINQVHSPADELNVYHDVTVYRLRPV